ncbi:BZIP domain-containing protein [Caenorhabditis elegans]|uniref:BZIP domain-containing protein n=2 Tax=Caenorhabditis elegans TaxID=6239 RepID=G5EGQ7_CAEEL|nr:BZIP domain-containing protein [Caenorhabditis elegans]CBK19465.1 BZIP domain-containing protein [Caenorhabditis elegans]|eukprot:NP_001255548.1 bZIP transcription factor family [Caenorhabditis elegans]
MSHNSQDNYWPPSVPNREYTMDGYHFHTQYNSNGQAGQAQPAYQVAHQNPRYQGNVPGRGSNFSMNPAANPMSSQHQYPYDPNFYPTDQSSHVPHHCDQRNHYFYGNVTIKEEPYMSNVLNHDDDQTHISDEGFGEEDSEMHTGALPSIDTPKKERKYEKVSEDQKDEKYSSKREKNNLAVKRCREKKKNEEKYKKEAFENLIRSNLVKDQKIEQLNNLVQSGKQRENARIMEVQREKNILRQLKNELTRIPNAQMLEYYPTLKEVLHYYA